MVPKDDECKWLLRWLQLIMYQLAMVPNDNECRWLHLWHRNGHCTNLMWFCMVCGVDDCIVDYNWSNISLQWHRMVISMSGCICGISIAIAPTCCESKDAMCEWSAHWHQVGHCLDCVILEIAYWHYLNQCTNPDILTLFRWNRTYPSGSNRCTFGWCHNDSQPALSDQSWIHILLIMVSHVQSLSLIHISEPTRPY